VLFLREADPTGAEAEGETMKVGGKPTVAELKEYAKKLGLDEDYTYCVNLLTGERAPWPDETIQKWIDQAWLVSEEPGCERNDKRPLPSLGESPRGKHPHEQPDEDQRQLEPDDHEGPPSDKLSLKAQLAEARAEAKRYHDALISKHGGEPVALLKELDEARAEVLTLKRKDREWYKAAEKLRAEVERLRAEYTRVAGPHRYWQDRAERAEAEADRLRPLQSPALFAEVERLRAQCEGLLNQNQEIAASNADHVGWHREAEAKLKAVVGALQNTSYAAGLLARALRAWAQPVTGMGANISQEDKGKWQMALREWEKADAPGQAALALTAQWKPDV
jgi:hypothetical protein